MVGAPSVKSGR